MGEIGIAGIGLAAGYLNRDDLTQKKFIPDFLNIPNNPSGRIYRTGDLGRINDQDEVEFHGRIDTQVKVRGYRIELTEIELVLMTVPQIAQAVVDVYEFEPGAPELVAYYSLKQGAGDVAPSEISETLRKHLPPYMVPSYLERLPVIPMTPSNKADRKNLPVPKGPRVSAGSGNFVAPRNDVEEALARALIGVMKVERVSVTDNFFQDLGAHSLLMARFAAEIRKTLDSLGRLDARHLSQSDDREACRAYRHAAGGKRGGGRCGRAGAARAGSGCVRSRLRRLRRLAATLLRHLRRVCGLAADARI